jgi:hypothetical protein
MAAIPQQLNYASGALNSLPEGTNSQTMVVVPSNGSKFDSDGAIITFDLPSRGYLQPSTMYLRYQATIVSTTTALEIVGTPAYTPFVNSTVLLGSQVVESIQNYNALNNVIYNTKMDVAGKQSYAYPLGYSNGATVESLNGRLLSSVTGEVISLAMPLNNVIANCDHLVPLKHMPLVRIQLTMDAVANMFTEATSTSTIALENLELVYDVTEFGGETEAVVASLADENGNIMIKSQSYSTSSQTLPTQVAGTQELVFNNRLSSIKSLFTILGGGAAAQVNGSYYDSVDITNDLGSYQFYIAGVPYPARPLSALRNKAGIFQELADCWSGNANDMYGARMSIMQPEFRAVAATTSTYDSPANFYIGLNTERLPESSTLLTGVSSQLTPIHLRVEFGSHTTTSSHLITLITLHDVILNCNILTKQASVKN